MSHWSGKLLSMQRVSVPRMRFLPKCTTPLQSVMFFCLMRVALSFRCFIATYWNEIAFTTTIQKQKQQQWIWSLLVVEEVILIPQVTLHFHKIHGSPYKPPFNFFLNCKLTLCKRGFFCCFFFYLSAFILLYNTGDQRSMLQNRPDKTLIIHTAFKSSRQYAVCTTNYFHM